MSATRHGSPLVRLLLTCLVSGSCTSTRRPRQEDTPGLTAAAPFLQPACLSRCG
jgi:hypothetical protein